MSENFQLRSIELQTLAGAVAVVTTTSYRGLQYFYICAFDHYCIELIIANGRARQMFLQLNRLLALKKKKKFANLRHGGGAGNETLTVDFFSR